MKLAIVASTVVLAMSASALASIDSGSFQVMQVNGKSVITMYAHGNSANDVVLSVFNPIGLSGVDYFDSDFAAGSWAPQLTNPADVTTDSYVTIGSTPGFTNSTQADPNWGAWGFTQPTIPQSAGWFNSNPPNLQGKVDASWTTLLGQFSVDGAATALPFQSITVAFNQGLGTPTQFAQIMFFPSPGAMALLCFAMLGPRRRRR